MTDFANPRVQAHAASAIINFTDECTPEILAPFLKSLLEKLHNLLRAACIVQEQVVTAIASIADCVGLEFLPYYDYFMPFLKEVLSTAHASEFSLLRSKAMECATIIGVAVGKEKFAQDVHPIVQILTQLHFEPGDSETPSPQLAWARLCKCLGKDFQPYLERVMPHLLEIAESEPEMEIINSEDVDQFDDDGWDVLPLGRQTVCIKTSSMEEKLTAINTIFCFVDELEEIFFPYVQHVAEIFVPALTFAFHESVRNTAATTLPCLIQSTIEYLKKNGQEGNMEPVQSLWAFIQSKFLKAICKETEVPIHITMIESYGDCVDLIGEASHTPESLKLANDVFHKILQKYLKARDIRAKSGETEEDFDVIEAEKLEELNKTENDVIGVVGELIGKMIQIFKGNFVSLFMEYSHIWRQMLSSYQRSRDCQIALCLFDDIAEHLKQESLPIVQDLYPFYCHPVPTHRPRRAPGSRIWPGPLLAVRGTPLRCDCEHGRGLSLPARWRPVVPHAPERTRHGERDISAGEDLSFSDRLDSL